MHPQSHPAASKWIVVLALSAAAATGVQVGAAMVATRTVVGEAGPASLALMRYVVGVLCLLPALLAGSARVRFKIRDALAISALGIGQFGVLIALLNWGLARVPAGRGALIFASFPLLTMLVAAVLGQERLSGSRSVGALLTLVGVGMATGRRLVGPTTDHGWSGDAAILAAALCGAVCSVLYRPYVRRYPALPVGALAMAGAVVALAVWAGIWEHMFAGWPRLTVTGWAAVLFIGVSSGVGYVLWLWALGRVSATRVSVFLSLSPVTALLLGALLLGEQVSVGAVAGLACIAAGLWFAGRQVPLRRGRPGERRFIQGGEP